MMNISPIVNSVKCTFFACIVHFLHVLEGSTATGRRVILSAYCTVSIAMLHAYQDDNAM